MWRRTVGAGALLVATVLGALAGAGPARAATQLSVSPSSGAPGSSFTVTGSGFPAGDVEIRWDTQSGPLLATATGPDFSVAATVPDDAAPNSHPVVGVARSGTAFSTSTAAYQVTGAPVETTTTTTTTVETTTTVAVATTTPAPSDRASSAPSAGSAGAAPDRAASGVTGGIDPELLSTTTGEAPLVPGAPAGSAATPTPTTAAATDAAPVTTTTAPSAGGSPGAGPSPTPSAAAAPAVAVQGGPQGAGAALGPKPTSQSSGSVRSPGLLVVGLLMAVAGAGFLAIRSRRRPGPPPDIPFVS